jgi:hypothetical protein
MKPTKAESIELLDMIEEFPDEPQDLIKLIHGLLISAYHNGCIDTLEKIKNDRV